MPDLKAQDARAASTSVRWRRIAVTAVFVVHGLLFASWTAHIPDVKAHLGLTDGALGLALLGAPAGSVTAMIAASWLLPKVGSRRIVRIALVGYCAAGPLVGLTGSLPALLPAAAEQPRSPDAPAERADAGRPPVRPVSRWSGAMIMLGAIAFAAMLCEGATADWSAVYLSGPLHARGVVPGLGYTVFSLAMVTVRLSGNRLLTRFRPDRLLPALALVATVGFSAALLIAQPAAALLGFVCLGIGLASVIPAVFSAAGRIPGLPPGTAVATASACGWAGFACGPPVIGWLSTWASLPVALGLLPLLTAVVVVATLTAHALRDRRRPGRLIPRDEPLRPGSQRKIAVSADVRLAGWGVTWTRQRNRRRDVPDDRGMEPS